MNYIWPPSVISKVMALLREWRRSDMKDKAILAVFFIPAMLSVGWLVFEIAFFILFNLPAFILRVLGLLLLISLFSGGGIFCYEKVCGKRAAGNPEPYAYDAASGETDAAKNKKNWFDDIKWFKK